MVTNQDYCGTIKLEQFIEIDRTFKLKSGSYKISLAEFMQKNKVFLVRTKRSIYFLAYLIA
ncbi:hypothetical protein Cyrtocomes_00773 [Candidatus Cyrtobacter comes]|uniref:Uncharacterized protein n=1 Tax=Candidatus Cyrtobacter comes TaxID=675776 RepID=A0ABU5L8E9_9RICK|nr:hypothetical protein [Candidatus Cyrtobacter comes]MDZ5762393.1 hypothetical protein [Candidatus Cyrtobacter comes]